MHPYLQVIGLSRPNTGYIRRQIMPGRYSRKTQRRTHVVANWRLDRKVDSTKGLTIASSNLPFQNRFKLLGFGRLTDTLPNLLTHNVHIPRMNGEKHLFGLLHQKPTTSFRKLNSTPPSPHIQRLQVRFVFLSCTAPDGFPRRNSG